MSDEKKEEARCIECDKAIPGADPRIDNTCEQCVCDHDFDPGEGNICLNCGMEKPF